MGTRTCILSPAGGFQSLLEDHHPHHQTSLTACLLQRTTPVHPSQLSLVLAELCWLLPLLSTPRHLLTPVQVASLQLPSSHLEKKYFAINFATSCLQSQKLLISNTVSIKILSCIKQMLSYHMPSKLLMLYYCSGGRVSSPSSSSSSGQCSESGGSYQYSDYNQYYHTYYFSHRQDYAGAGH